MYILRYLFPKLIGLACCGSLLGIPWGIVRWYIFLQNQSVIGIVLRSMIAFAWITPAAWLVFTSVDMMNQHRGAWHFRKAAKRYVLAAKRDTLRSLERQIEQDLEEAEKSGNGAKAEILRAELEHMKKEHGEYFQSEISG